MSYDSVVLGQAPDAYLLLEEDPTVPATAAQDATANNRDGVYGGSPSAAAHQSTAGILLGTTSKAVRLGVGGGANVGRVEWPHGAWQNAGGQLTMTLLWRWEASIPSSGTAWIMGKDNAGSSADLGWRLDTDTGKFRSIVYVPTSVVKVANNPSAFVANKTYWLCLWHDGANLRNFAIPLDGTTVHTAATIAAAITANNTFVGSVAAAGSRVVTSTKTVGAGASEAFTFNAHGIISRPALWCSRALTNQEIADQYNAANGTTPVVAPGVPTAVAVSGITDDQATITWGAPATGSAPTGYVVRLNSDPLTDTAVGLVFTDTWSGLDEDTPYTLAVAAYNFAGTSAFVTVPFRTLDPTPEPPGWYRATLTVGEYLSWDIVKGAGPTYGPVLPLSLGWSVADSVDYFPAQPDATTMVFDLLLESADDLLGPGFPEPYKVKPGEPVTFTLYLDDAGDAQPWQAFTGIVTQLDARATDKKADGTHDLRVTVYAADDTMRLDRIPVGFTDDWPQESIADRVDRVADEAGLDVMSLGGTGQEGTLGPKDATRPTTALAALRDALAYAGSDNTSELGHEYYGRFLYAMNVTTTPHTLVVVPWERRLYPGSTIVLDGALVEAAVAWTMIPQPDASGTWAIVDGITFGTPDGTPPRTVSTNLVDTTPSNPSAVTRDNLGEALLSQDSTVLDGWYARTLRYRPADVDDMELVRGLCAFVWGPILQCYTIQVTPVTEELRVGGEDYLAGTLTGARLVLAPGGRVFVDLRLRPELLDGWDSV